MRVGSVPCVAREAALLFTQVAFRARSLRTGEDGERRRLLYGGRSFKPGGDENLLQVTGTDDRIHFRNVLADFIAIAFDQASGHDELAGGSRSFVARHFENGI